LKKENKTIDCFFKIKYDKYDLSYLLKKYMTKTNKIPFGNICGSGIIGERGQIVIPKEARDILRIKPGDRFLFVEHLGNLVLLPEVVMKDLLKKITLGLKK